MSAPPAPEPASSASSSMTSFSMRVESTSSTTRKAAMRAGMPSVGNSRELADDLALADHRDARIRHREAARAIRVMVDADGRPGGDHHVFVENSALNHRVLADAHTLEHDGVDHLGSRLDRDPGAQHTALQVTTRDHAAQRDDGIDRGAHGAL